MLAGNATSFDATSGMMGDIVQPGCSLMLTKQFKGLELNQAVRLLEVNPNGAMLQASDPKLVPLLEGNVCLHSHAFASPIAARVQDIQGEDGVFRISDFTYRDWQARQYLRVQPKDPTYVTLRWRQKEARLCLEDISAQGMGVFAGREFENEIKIRPGQVARLSFQLPGITFDELDGNLLYQFRMGQWVVKLGLRLFPNGKQRRGLEQYVARRKEEIMEEVSQIYIRAHEPRGIESQYF